MGGKKVGRRGRTTKALVFGVGTIQLLLEVHRTAHRVGRRSALPCLQFGLQLINVQFEVEVVGLLLFEPLRSTEKRSVSALFSLVFMRGSSTPDLPLSQPSLVQGWNREEPMGKGK